MLIRNTVLCDKIGFFIVKRPKIERKTPKLKCLSAFKSPKIIGSIDKVSVPHAEKPPLHEAQRFLIRLIISLISDFSRFYIISCRLFN